MNPQDSLIQELTGNQNRLYGFILTLIPDRDRARDVLQETNLVIWRKAEEFEPGTNFWAWAAQIAYFQALSYCRDRSRERLVFDESVLANLRTCAEEFSGDDQRRSALHDCLAGLQESQRNLVTERYRRERPLDEIAQQTGRSVAAVKMALMRVRKALFECIQGKMAQQRQ